MAKAQITHEQKQRAYAQRRYKELTGWPCPSKGGLSRSQMTYDQKQRDYSARLQVSQELGHSRVNIISTYCGN